MTILTGPATESDIEQIRRLAHSYAKAIDQGQVDDVVALFTADGIWDPRTIGMDVARGAHELRTGLNAVMERISETFHLTSNHVVDVTPNAATGTSYYHSFMIDAQGNRGESLGLFTDEYVRTPQGWKFQRRTIKRSMSSA